MVLERLLEHAVHVLEVLGDGEPVVVPVDRPHVTPSRGPGRDVASAAVTGRVICSHVRVRRNPAAVSQPCCRASSAYAPESSSVEPSPRTPAMSTACRSPAPKRAAAGRRRPRRGARGDRHLDEGAPGGAVVHRQPRDEPTRRRRGRAPGGGSTSRCRRADRARRRGRRPTTPWRRLVGGEQGGDVGSVRRRGDPGREPAGRASMVRSASFTRTTLPPPRPRLHAATEEGTHGDTTRRRATSSPRRRP